MEAYPEFQFNTRILKGGSVLYVPKDYGAICSRLKKNFLFFRTDLPYNFKITNASNIFVILCRQSNHDDPVQF